MKSLLTLGLALALSTASFAANHDDEPDLQLVFQKGHYEDKLDETRAFGDLKYNPPFVLHEGHVRVPIIMVDFPDQGFTFSKETLYDLYMGKHPIGERPVKASGTTGFGYGSAQEYFYENSFGKLDFEFDFYGPYTMPQNMKYYGKGEGRTLSRLLTDILPLADDDIDFAKYDNDGDSICEIVYFLFAGQGANFTKNKEQIWPSCGIANTLKTNDGITLCRAGTNNELLLPEGNTSLSDGRALINGMGVFCHELSHGMGLPDLYCDESRSDYDNIGPEDWDLMDNGENVRNGFWPTPYTTWEHMIMGWTQPEELTFEQQVTVYPLNDEQGRGQAFVVRNPANHDEFWTIENIPSNGWYAGLYGGGNGIIISHIDYSDDPFRFYKMPNNREGKPRCTIIPADGRLLSSFYLHKYHPDGSYVTSQVYASNLYGDPYPGSTGTTELTAYHNYAGEEDLAKTLPITRIHQNDDGSVSFHFGGDPSGIGNLHPDDADSPLYDLQGRRINNMQPGQLYIKNNRKQISEIR